MLGSSQRSSSALFLLVVRWEAPPPLPLRSTAIGSMLAKLWLHCEFSVCWMFFGPLLTFARNFSKNILHGLVFSLFINKWLDADGSKNVFVTIGGIQVACLLTTIPMYIYGKRARMWTVRKNLMEKF